MIGKSGEGNGGLAFPVGIFGVVPNVFPSIVEAEYIFCVQSPVVGLIDTSLDSLSRVGTCYGRRDEYVDGRNDITPVSERLSSSVIVTPGVFDRDVSWVVHECELGDTERIVLSSGVLAVYLDVIVETDGVIIVHVSVADIDQVVVGYQDRHEDRRGVHNHRAIVEAIAVANVEIGIEVASLGYLTVGTVDKSPYVFSYVRLFVSLDF